MKDIWHPIHLTTRWRNYAPSRATSSREHVHHNILEIRDPVCMFCPSSHFLFLQLFITIENCISYYILCT